MRLNKKQVLDNRFAFTEDEILEVNALELCELLIELERLKRQVEKLSYDKDILNALYELKKSETPTHIRVDLRA